jgi:outer membrane protein TolC
MKQTYRLAAVGLAVAICSCQQVVIDRADRSVYRAITDRQQRAIGAVSDVHIGTETGALGRNERMYDFVPRSVDSNVPEGFQQSPYAEPVGDDEAAAAAVEPAGEPEPSDASDVGTSFPEAEATEQLVSPSIFTPEQLERILVFRLSDALNYAFRHARDLQGAKEDLYLAALDLTLERHLWTPQLVAAISAEVSDAGRAGDFDRALTAVSDVAVSQRLPFGGEITARGVGTLMRDLREHVTTGESGQVILEADLPLLRGAGRAAYETRYIAERELIYAVRTYEHFRRSFAVRVAADYFDLQQRQAEINNAYKSYQTRREDWEKADFVNRMGRSRTVFDATRARSSFRSAETALVSAKERYAFALDQFKITIGMPVEELIDVVDQEDDRETEAFDRISTTTEESVAIAAALKYRLDLLNVADAVDDSQRGVRVAKNRILPDLDVTASYTFGSDPDHLSATRFEDDRSAWRGAAELRIDDRKRERNAYRASLIGYRRALRRVEQQRAILNIQALNVEENKLRLDAAKAQYDLGKIENRDVVEADTDLLTARNLYAVAVAGYRNALLEYRRDTGTLRINEEGEWAGP